MVVFITILPNIYWIYNNPIHPKTANDYKIDMNKFIEQNHIKTIIELDEKFTFWKKSNDYINDIKLQIEKDEFSKLYTILTKLNDIIKQNYTNNTPLIISTYNTNYIELGLSIWIYFFNQTASIPFDTVIKLLSIKIIGNIKLSDTLKKFFAFLNLNNLSGKTKT